MDFMLFASCSSQFFFIHKSRMDNSPFDLQVLCRFANMTRWRTNWYQKAKLKLTVYLHPFLSSLRSFHLSLVGAMPKSCLIFEHQWPSASLRCGPVYNSSQPGSSLKNTCQKRPSAWFHDHLSSYLSIGLLIFSVWRMSLRATVFSVSILQLSFLDMSGSHRKNSWRRVLTVSGHSIMTM